MGEMRTHFLSKESTELANSVFWFAMDACWMFSANMLSIAFAIPTVLSGIWLIRLENRPDARNVDIAMLFWIVMNAGWLCSEIFSLPTLLVASKISFFFGVSFIILALKVTENWKKTVGYFKRFRISEFQKLN